MKWNPTGRFDFRAGNDSDVRMRQFGRAGANDGSTRQASCSLISRATATPLSQGPSASTTRQPSSMRLGSDVASCPTGTGSTNLSEYSTATKTGDAVSFGTSSVSLSFN